MKQHIRNNATTFQLPFISPVNLKSHGISSVRSNKEYSDKIKSNKTQPIIEKLNPLPFLNPLPNNNTQKNKLFLSKNNENINSLSWTNLEYKKLTSNKFTELDPKRQKICVAVKPSKFPIDDRNIIKIVIEDNWENTPKIMMYFIALFDKKNSQINSKSREKFLDKKDTIYITSYPESSSLIKLENLFDSSYIEDCKNNFFCEFFGSQKFSLYLSFPQTIELGSILIFNTPTKSPSAVKDVSIYSNEELTIKGQIPQDFGLSLKFDFFEKENEKSTTGKSKKKYCSIPRTIAYKDNYGILPIKPIGQISIEIIETYNCKIKINCCKENNITKIKNCTENYIGVNGFDFYDILDNYIENQSYISSDNGYQYIKEAKIRGISELIYSGMLLKKDKQTNNKEKMFLGLMDRSQYPSFNFSFNRPIYLSKISIWNFNGFGENLNCGIKKLKVYADNKLVWFGKIPKGSGDEKESTFFTIHLYQPNINITEIKI